MDASHIAPLNLCPVDAARVAGVSRARLFELLKSGEIRSFKDGRSRLVPLAEIVAWTTRKMEPVTKPTVDSF